MGFRRADVSLTAVCAAACFLLTPAGAFGQPGQWYQVDCTGNTPGAYKTINSVLPLISSGASISVTGPCTENATIGGLSNILIAGQNGQALAINGNITLNSVQNVILYQLNVSNPSGDGIDINSSSNVTVNQCTSSNNGNFGLNVNTSSVNVQGPAAFSNNGNYGISAGGASDLSINGYSGPINVNSNVGGGIELQDGVMGVTNGNLIVSNNKATSGPASALPGFASGYGIQMLGHSRAVLYSWSSSLAPDVISGNAAGGIAVEEGSELSMSSGGPPSAPGWVANIVEGNGPVGIYVGMGSQLSLIDGAEITNHADAGVYVYGHSEVAISGNDQLTNNGTGPGATYPLRAGIRLDGNSEAYIRGGQISQNGGPGVLALTGSSIDISGATLNANVNGNLVCDSSSWMAAAQPAPPGPPGPPPPPPPPPGAGCSVPKLTIP